MDQKKVRIWTLHAVIKSITSVMIALLEDEGDVNFVVAK